ncbi:hypothetical protein KM043_004066 [Ampulex compressa]|nr:hypothetical protein KM043_004066 [Ampulex compressa]
MDKLFPLSSSVIIVGKVRGYPSISAGQGLKFERRPVRQCKAESGAEELAQEGVANNGERCRSWMRVPGSARLGSARLGSSGGRFGGTGEKRERVAAEKGEAWKARRAEEKKGAPKGEEEEGMEEVE